MLISKTSASTAVLRFYLGVFPGANLTLSCLSYKYRSAALLCGCQCKGRSAGGAYFSLGSPIIMMFVVGNHLASLATAVVRENNKFNVVAWLIKFFVKIVRKMCLVNQTFLS